VTEGDIHLLAFFPGQPGLSDTRKVKPFWISGFLDFNEARDDGVAVASAGPYATHLHLTPER